MKYNLIISDFNQSEKRVLVITQIIKISYNPCLEI